mmetsp:Transcript_2745/g.5803  ORF Transcript_2745/g.5803 Transcript_2745/m.5803 type:complete len:221 (+) Transcript_2745:153-815(+)
MVGAPPAPCSSTMATPRTATAAGSRRMTLKLVLVSSSNESTSCCNRLTADTRMASVTAATKTQCRVQITQDRLAVVVSKPKVCPKYPKATHDPQMAAPLAVSHVIKPCRIAPMEPGSNARKAVLNRATAYKVLSTAGSAMTSLAAAKLDAQRAHNSTITPRQSQMLLSSSSLGVIVVVASVLPFIVINAVESDSDSVVAFGEAEEVASAGLQVVDAAESE